MRVYHAPKKANVFSDCTVKRLAGLLAAGLNFSLSRQRLIPSSPGSSPCAIILAHPKREKQLCIGWVCSMPALVRGSDGITVLMPQ